MKKALLTLGIIQEVSNINRTPQLGKGFTTAKRLNPYNPLSYLFLIGVFIGGMLMFGFIGFWKEVDPLNVFKWN